MEHFINTIRIKKAQIEVEDCASERSGGRSPLCAEGGGWREVSRGARGAGAAGPPGLCERPGRGIPLPAAGRLAMRVLALPLVPYAASRPAACVPG
ncbi:unnamed protein product [Danaus chrysippus]|uniref:(African queen) hypothetical protein n=1 Tax=Danaus chrysippus TaxID=151541 RepID=A0A8J2VZN7_9NEOP|nr:unnamed protein product [Danaus chrysippus]